MHCFFENLQNLDIFKTGKCMAYTVDIAGIYTT